MDKLSKKSGESVDITNSKPAAARGRVKISGRLGLTAEDQYVLRCAATVDDQPIETYVSRYSAADGGWEDAAPPAPPAPAAPPAAPPPRPRGSTSDSRRSSPTQTGSDAGHDRTLTHVNLNLYFSADGKIQNQDVTNNGRRSKMKVYQSQETCESNVLAIDKDHEAPLIIISVYPNNKSPAAADAAPLRLSKDSSSDVKPSTSKLIRSVMGVEQKAAAAHGAGPASPPRRASSPQRTHTLYKTTSQQLVTKQNNHGNKQNKQYITANKQNSNGNKQNNNRKALRNVSRDSASPRSPSPRRATPAPAPDRRESYTPTSNRRASPAPAPDRRASPTPAPARRGSQGKETRRPQIKATDHETNQGRNKTTKNSLINDKSYTKNDILDKLTSEVARQYQIEKDKNAKVSNVSVNIDADDDYYNLIFYQHNRDTDLIVRKRSKTDHSKRANSPSADFKMNSRKSSLKITDHHDLEREILDVKMKPKPEHPPVSIRDSIELGHERKRESASRLSWQDRKCPQDCESKHYSGDSCHITDPMEREQEIRALLGVQKKKRKSKDYDMKASKREYIGRLKCLYGGATKSLNNPECSKLCSTCKKGSKVLRKPKERPKPSYKIINRNNSITLTDKDYVKVKKVLDNITTASSTELRKGRIQKRNTFYIGPKKYTYRSKTLQNVAETQTDECLKTKIKRPCLSLSETFKNKTEHKAINRFLSSYAMKKSMEDGHKNEFIARNSHLRQEMPSHRMSSVEVRYADLTLTQFTVNREKEPTKIELNELYDNVDMPPEGNHMKCKSSILTLFKARPHNVRSHRSLNLGTSALSLETIDKEITKKRSLKTSRNYLIQKLLKCQALKKLRGSRAHVGSVSAVKPCNSLDSYYVNSSLAARPMSSSLFDTSASFVAAPCSLHSPRRPPRRPPRHPPRHPPRRGLLTSLRNFFTFKISENKTKIN